MNIVYEDDRENRISYAALRGSQREKENLQTEICYK